jgi:hypothetical protein
MFNTIVNKNGENRKYFNEYVWLASTSQTSGGWNKQSFRQIDNKLLKKSAGQKAVRYMDRIADVITAPANYSEIMTRATEYIRLRKEGYPQRIALEQAGRVSAPFHHTGRLGGKTGRELIRGIPYANASLQVLAQTARTLRTPEGQKRYAFVASAIVAASTASLLYALSDDDKENEFVKQAYNALSPSELSKAIYIKNPYDNHLFSMRTPEQMTFFSTLTNMAILEHYNDANYSKKEWLQGSDSWLPDQLKPYEGTRWLMSVYPHLLKGVTEVALNKKTFPTVRDIENYADQKKPVEYRFDDWTSPTAKLLANTELAKGLNLSPKKIDHLIGAYGGRSAQFATLKPNRLKIPEVFDRGIYFNASRQMQWYYDFKKHNDEQKSVMNTLKGDEIGNVVKYDALIDIVEDNLKIYREINEVKEPKKADAYKLLIFKFVKILKDQTD